MICPKCSAPREWPDDILRCPKCGATLKYERTAGPGAKEEKK